MFTFYHNNFSTLFYPFFLLWLSLYLFLIINNSFEAETFSSQSSSKHSAQSKSQLYSKLFSSNALLIESSAEDNKDADATALSLKDIFTFMQLQNFLN